MNFTVPVYQSREAALYRLTTLGLGPHSCARSAPTAQKAERVLIEHLRTQAAALKPSDLPWFQFARGTRLERVRVELNLRGSGKKRRLSGRCPLILEPRWTSESQRLLIAYHPHDQHDWFPVQEDEPLEQQAALFLQKLWSGLTDDEVRLRWTDGKDFLKMVSFSAETRTLFDQLPTRKKSVWDDLTQDPARTGQKPTDRPQRRLPRLAVDLTARALEGGLRPGLPRSPHRERLQQLLGGARKQSTLLVGPSGSGKTSLVHQWVHDLIAADDYPSHRNSDRLHHVWALGGRRLIAGMSHVGEWEQQCMEVLDEARSRKVVLYLDDIGHFGRIGRSKGSDRCLADLFQGPIARGEVVVVGELTPEQLRSLEDDAPTFASVFVRVAVPEATATETFRMLLHLAREFERGEGAPAVSPYALRTMLQLGGALFPNRAMPAKALEVLRQLLKEEQPAGQTELGPAEVVRLLARRTGLPEILLRPEEPLVAADLAAELGRQVIGQARGVSAMVDLILRIKGGLVDPRRPYGVFLFTGPTGTGKTELAKCLADYLYGDEKRLLRLDMSEFSGPDAPARLIGDRWQPEGILTQRVQEQPFCVVLLDEIEKAHPSILNLLLQLFDEGRLTSASGAVASFTQAVVVMTSNLGARPNAPLGFGDQSERLAHDIARAVREFFPPELFNRIDQIVPFAPLSHEVAVAVAHKEMTRLFGRRGLTDRNIFVYVTSAVAELIAREAFAQQDGARSLKRSIEARLGAVLSDLIARGPQTAMQVVRIFEAGGQLQIDLEPLHEAAPAPYVWTLEPLLDQPLAALQLRLPQVLAFLRQLAQSDDLQRLAEQIRFHLREHNLGRSGHADQLYNLDAIRSDLGAFLEQVERFAQPPEESGEALEVAHFSRMEVTYADPYRARGGYTVSRRLLDRRVAEQAPQRPTRPDVLAALAETEFLRRALDQVHDAEQHAVFLELWRASRGAGGGRFERDEGQLLGWLSRAYGEARGTLEEVAVRLTRGDVIDLRGIDLVERMDEWIGQGAERVVLKVVGLCVRDFFELETGSHVWQSVAEQPEIVQVRVRPALAGVGARQLLDEHAQARVSFEAALRRGESPTNPDRLLPAVRKLRFDPPRRPGAVALLEVEDYVLSYGAAMWVKRLPDALPPLWMLRMSGRREGPGDGATS